MATRGTWTWEAEGRLSTIDNPLFGANLKAKKLRGLLQRQKAFQKKGPPPFIEALVFCSARDLKCDLQGHARTRVCLRDRPGAEGGANQAGIVSALVNRQAEGLEPRAKGVHDRPMAKAVGQALDQAGIRPSQRSRKVSDYVLERLIGEGPGYQDWQAVHVRLVESKRRVRLYLVRREDAAAERDRIERAARREFQLLESLEHPGVLRAHAFTEHEVGPALLFEHDPSSIRLDHYLSQQQGRLSVERQLDLLRQIAEVVRFAHDKKIVHRALSPQSILVMNPAGPRPRIKLFNWQVGLQAINGVKFLECLPPTLAARTLASRVIDIDGASAIVSQPCRLISFT